VCSDGEVGVDGVSYRRIVSLVMGLEVATQSATNLRVSACVVGVLVHWGANERQACGAWHGHHENKGGRGDFVTLMLLLLLMMMKMVMRS
jgi:hypothetical protein